MHRIIDILMVITATMINIIIDVFTSIVMLCMLIRSAIDIFIAIVCTFLIIYLRGINTQLIRIISCTFFKLTPELALLHGIFKPLLNA